MTKFQWRDLSREEKRKHYEIEKARLKPLNAFMLYMNEMRSVLQAECTLKEAAAINQILGQRVRPPVHICCLILKK